MKKSPAIPVEWPSLTPVVARDAFQFDVGKATLSHFCDTRFNSATRVPRRASSLFTVD